MPQYTIKEVAQLTGIPSKNLHTLAGRGKLIKIKVTENDKQVVKIDTTNPINEAFIFEHENNTTPKKLNGHKKEINGNKKETTPGPLSDLQTATLEQKQLAVLKAKRELELKEIELQEKKGEVIDFKKALSITSSYSSSLQRDLDQLIQTHIQDICARHGIEATKAAQYKKKVSELINESSQTSIELLLKQFES